jgi:hypothetical protein
MRFKRLGYIDLVSRNMVSVIVGEWRYSQLPGTFPSDRWRAGERARRRWLARLRCSVTRAVIENSASRLLPILQM